MSQIRAALSMILMGFVGPLVLMLLGAVIALALFQGEGVDRDDPKQVKGVSLSDDGETVHVALEVEEGMASKAILLHGPSGKELAKFHLYRDGGFSLERPGTEPFGFVVHRDASGSSRVSVTVGRRILVLNARTGGPAKIAFEDVGGNIVLDVDAEGNILSHPSPQLVDPSNPRLESNR